MSEEFGHGSGNKTRNQELQIHFTTAAVCSENRVLLARRGTRTYEKTRTAIAETRSFNLNHRKPGWRLAIRWFSLLATLALALAVAPRAGATITVTSLDDSGPGSLRQAIADAAPGDTIDFTSPQPDPNQPNT